MLNEVASFLFEHGGWNGQQNENVSLQKNLKVCGCLVEGLRDNIKGMCANQILTIKSNQDLGFCS